MSYGLIYTVPFATLYNEECVVEIEKEGYSGESRELTPAGDSPFTIEISDEEFLYAPARFSTATIRIVGSDYIQSLFSTAYQQYRVTFRRGGEVTWCGFIKPELYTQDYSSEIFELELECMSAMSSLEYIDYKQADKGGLIFVSLWDLIRKCVSSASARYEAVYVPHVYGADEIEYTSENNVLDEMTVSEQNFFDEDDKPMKLKDVLDNVCKFLNWTCVDWRGELYFVDVDHLGEYRLYDPVSFDWAGNTVSPEVSNVQFLGFSGSDHSLDVIPGYNKVTVRCSNYPVGEFVPKDDISELPVLATPADETDGNRVCHKLFLYPGNIGTRLYTKFIPLGWPEPISLEVTDLSPYKGKPDAADNLLGAINMRYCIYNMVKKIEGWVPDITSYSYQDVIRVRQRNSKKDEIGQMDPLLSIRGKTAVYYDGAFCISGSIKLYDDKDLNASSLSPFGDYKGKYVVLRVSLRIGDLYYDGKGGWVRDSFTKFGVLGTPQGKDNEYTDIDSTKTLSMPYSDLDGYIIELPRKMMGDVELCLYPTYAKWSSVVTNHPDTGFFLKDFKLSYKNADWVKDDDNSDRTYENVINEGYINELDEIEFKISSYNNDGACYSKVMLGNDYLRDNLYSSIEMATVRPEEQLIRRIVNRYGAPRIKLTQVIKEIAELTPITRFSDNYMDNKRFICAGGTIDYKMDQFKCIMIEV